MELPESSNIKKDELEDLFRQACDQGIEGFAIHDTKGRFIYINPTQAAMYGYSPNEVLGNTWEIFYKKEQVDEINNVHFPKLQKDGHWRGKLLGLKKDGSVFNVEVSLTLLTCKNGKPKGLACNCRDITEQLKAEKTLQEAKETAESANKAKSQFLANMSHEIRTPMTAILGYASLLVEMPPENPEEKYNAASRIQANAEHLLTIINDILDVSKIEAQKMNLESIQTNPAQIANEVMALVESSSKRKGIDLSIRYETLVPKTIKTDPTKLRQILLNLVGNAIKFTESGSVTIYVSCNVNKQIIKFKVVDTGIGISIEKLKSISNFKAFNQGDTSTTRKFGGSGLGLMISHTFAKMLGGEIEIESKEGKGSSFSVTITTDNLSEVEMFDPTKDDIPDNTINKKFKTIHKYPNKPLDNYHILLVEDGIDNQRLISYHLEKAGANVTICENGLDAIKEINKLSINKLPHLVLMDMQMPELNGYDTTKHLRENGFTMPIIAITAHAMRGDKEKCIKVGCDEYLSKPIDKNKMINTCVKFTS